MSRQTRFSRLTLWAAACLAAAAWAGAPDLVCDLQQLQIGVDAVPEDGDSPTALHSEPRENPPVKAGASIQLSSASDMGGPALKVGAERKSLPRSVRVAVVLRGEPFRSDGRFAPGCTDAAVESQMAATRSLVDFVLAPLEKLNNTVDVFVADSTPDCHLMSMLIGVLGKRVKVRSAEKPPTKASQCANFRHALEVLKAGSGLNGRVQDRYGLVFVTRLDLRWGKSIEEWPTADFSGFNFFSGCERGAFEGCVNDILHILPGSMFSRFDAEVGTGKCFNKEWDPWKLGAPGGHFCRQQIARSVGEGSIHTVTDWRPTKNVREASQDIVFFTR